jgi:dTMP kinase
MKTLFLYSKVIAKNFLAHFIVRKNRKHGYYIVIDGGEGSGKDTVIERLRAKYPHVEFSREPGGTPYAEEMRAVMLNSKNAKEANAATQMLLVTAGRSDHVDRKGENAILNGRHFLTNRGNVTTWGYQLGGQQGGYELKKLFFEIHKAIYTKISPDLYVILEVSPEEGARRVAARKGEINHYDERKKDFHLRVMQAYRQFGKLYPFKVKYVDANKSKDEVFNAVDALVGPLLSRSAS